jgi:hypothetical protein
MPDERTARIAARGTHAEAGLQQVKGQMAFVLLEQAHQERVLARCAVHDRAIDDEQAIGIAVLDHVSIKVWALYKPERLFVVFPLDTLALYHLSSLCSSHPCTLLWKVSYSVCPTHCCLSEKHIGVSDHTRSSRKASVFDELTPCYKIHAVERQSNVHRTRTSVLEIE